MVRQLCERAKHGLRRSGRGTRESRRTARNGRFRAVVPARVNNHLTACDAVGSMHGAELELSGGVLSLISALLTHPRATMNTYRSREHKDTIS